MCFASLSDSWAVSQEGSEETLLRWLTEHRSSESLTLHKLLSEAQPYKAPPRCHRSPLYVSPLEIYLTFTRLIASKSPFQEDNAVRLSLRLRSKEMFKTKTVKSTRSVQEVRAQCDFFTGGKTSTDLSFHGFFSHAVWRSLEAFFPPSAHPPRAVSGLVVSDCCPLEPSGYITDWSRMVAELEI